MSKANPVNLASGGQISPDYLQHARASFLDETLEASFIQACGRPLRKSIRVNTLKISIDEFQQIANQYGWKLANIPWCAEGFWIENEEKLATTSFGNLPEHIQGLFYIQEASSMLPPNALLQDCQLEAPRVVDMAAAPGSKTTQLSAMLNNRGIILANELSASRLKSLHRNLVRCGVLNVCMSHLDARKIGEFMPGQFDYVLLDAPCGGEGTVRKDQNALANWQLEKVKELAELQKQLILSAYSSLKPGGVLVYSTCTLSLEENHHVANFLLEKTDAQVISLKNLFVEAEKALTAQGFLHILPNIFDSEGFFVAKFKKPYNCAPAKSPIEIYSSPFEPISRKMYQTLTQYYQKHFGFNIFQKNFKFMERKKEIWVFPEDIECINRYIKVNRAGMKIAEVYPNKIRTSHELACCFGYLFEKQKLELDSEQFACFLKGQNLNVEAPFLNDGEVLLTFKEHVIGIAQKQNKKLKSGLPRELVLDNYVT